MERISIFNYEAYYLDYLEGKLSEKDAALLFEFLEQHPECKLDDEEFTSIVSEELTLDNSLKQSLKQVDENDNISLNNLDHFLIAQAEGILESEKETELENFVVANNLQQEKRLIAATYFDQNEQYIYADKAELKQTVQVRLWPYAAAAASVLIIVMIYLFGGQGSVIEPNQQILANDQQESPEKIQNNPKNEQENSTKQNEDSYALTTEPSPVSKGQPVLVAKELPNTRSENLALENVPVRRILSPKVALELEPLSQQLVSNPPTYVEPQNQDYATLHFNGINNPIKPITKALSEKTNREIDFRSGKSNTDDSKGFFVKIGKFEFSRKKH